jgi:hypothetical protein
VTEGSRPPAMKQFRRMLEGLRTELAFSIHTGLPMTAVRGVELVK